MVYGMSEFAFQQVQHLKPNGGDFFLVQEPSFNPHESLTYKSVKTNDFIFFLGDNYTMIESRVHVHKEIISMGSDVLAGIIDIQEKAASWYAVLNEKSGFGNLDHLQFKRMIEFFYTEDIKDIHDDVDPNCIFDIASVATLFKATSLERFCWDQMKLRYTKRDHTTSIMKVVPVQKSLENSANSDEQKENVSAKATTKPGWMSKMKREILTQVKVEVIEHLKNEILNQLLQDNEMEKLVQSIDHNAAEIPTSHSDAIYKGFRAKFKCAKCHREFCISIVHKRKPLKIIKESFEDPKPLTPRKLL